MVVMSGADLARAGWHSMSMPRAMANLLMSSDGPVPDDEPLDLLDGQQHLVDGKAAGGT